MVDRDLISRTNSMVPSRERTADTGRVKTRIASASWQGTTHGALHAPRSLISEEGENDSDPQGVTSRANEPPRVGWISEAQSTIPARATTTMFENSPTPHTAVILG